MRAFLADGLFADGDTGTVDQPAQNAECLRCADCGLRVLFIGDVASNKTSDCAELARQRFTPVDLNVGDDDAPAVGRNHSRDSAAKAGGAPGNKEGVVIDLHESPTQKRRILESGGDQ